MKRRWWVVIGLVALLATACGAAAEKLAETATEKALEAQGGGDVDIDVSDDGSVNISVEGEDGSSLNIGSDIPLPDGLTIPVPDGGSATQTGSDGSYVFVSLIYPRDRYEEIVAFYDDWTDGTGTEWSRSESTFSAGDAGTQRSVFFADGATAISVSDCFTLQGGSDQFDGACVTINESR